MATDASESWLGAVAVPALVVILVLAGGLIVGFLGLRPSTEPPTLEAVVDDRRGKKKRKEPQRDKKQSNGQVAHEPEVKAKNRKPPAEDKSKERKAKEKAPEPKPVQPKPAEKKTPKKESVKKAKEVPVKPADYDDGDWEKVPSRSDKKKKNQEEKKESPSKKKNKENKKDDRNEDRPEPPPIPKDLQEKVNELQRVLNEVEKRDRSQTPIKLEDSSESSAPPTPDKKEKKKDIKKPTEVEFSPPQPKNVKKQVSESSDIIEKPATEAVFDELGDTWTDAKIMKKGKKKTRKDQ